jgi:hypothetical protein
VDRVDQVRSSFERLNTRDFDAVIEMFAPDVRFHGPDISREVTDRDALRRTVGGHIEADDLHFIVDDVAEYGPFVVAFIRVDGLRDGRSASWRQCNTYRYRDDLVAEVWALRSEPESSAA